MKGFIKFFWTICLLFSLQAFTVSVTAQGIRVTGMVTEAGDPFPGITVIVKGTSNGTNTEGNGRYNITVPNQNSVLQFSYLGYVTQEVTVGNRTVIDVEMQESTFEIDEVVIVGYGVQRKASLTGSVASISASEIQNIPVSNLSNALSGKLAGVRIQSFTGSPGTASSLNIRSVGTWNNTDPLYVIDGVIRDKDAFNLLNPSDIENLSVLKDGASAAVYGSRAANGVVLVTTRKGRISKPVISVSSMIGQSRATKIPKAQSAYNQALLVNERYDAELRDRIENVERYGEPPFTWDPKAQSDYFTDDEVAFFKNHSWVWLNGDDGFLRNPIVTQHSLNVSGGNEFVRFFTGASYHYENGIFDNIDFNKYNIRGNIEANITKNLIASLNLNMDNQFRDRYNWEYENNGETLNDFFKGLLIKSQMCPAYINGKPIGLPYVEWHPGIQISGDAGYNRDKTQNYELTAALEYKLPFVKGLSLKLQFNRYNRYRFLKRTWLPYTMYNVNTIGGHGHIPDLDNPGLTNTRLRSDGNRLLQRTEMRVYYQLNGYVTYNRTFGKHDVGALFVYEQAEDTYDWMEARRNDYNDLTIDQLNAGGTASLTAPTGSGEEGGRLSYIGRLNYAFANKYIIEASFRYDASIRFAPTERWGFFPSASVAWRISEEGFFRDNVPLFNNLKFRAAIGMLGNDAVGGWQWARRYNYTSAGGQFYGVHATGINLTGINNPYLTWEKSKLYDGGFDATLLNNRLSMAANLFYRFTYDIMGNRTQVMPSSFGASMPAENYGEMSVKGYELEASWNDRVDEVRYYIKGNFGYARSKLLKWDEAANIRPYQSRIGLTRNNIALGSIATGIIRTQEELDAILAANPDYRIYGQRPRLGMMNYKDIRGPNGEEPDGIIDDNDREYIQKDVAPPINYGFGFGAIWKGVTLDLHFQGVGKYDVMVGGGVQSVQARIPETNLDFWTDHWTPSNPNASMPRPYNNQAGRNSTFWMKNGSYLRLKSLTVGYDVPKKVMSQIGIANLKVFFEGQNLLLLIDHIKWFDPEIGNQGNNSYCYPNTKSFTFGINLTI